MTERPWSAAAKTSCPLPLKLFLLLSAFLTLCRAEDDLESLLQDDSRLQRRKHHHDWDHLTLTQQWPPTACIAAAGHHRCVIPKGVKTWTLHGLWPTLKHTHGPFNCNNSWHFNENQIRDLEPAMNVSWPNLFADTSMVSLWKHEWTKHGTCAASLPALRGEHNYFGRTLKLRTEFPLEVILAKSSIEPHPSKGYEFQDIASALQNTLNGKAVNIQCFQANPRLRLETKKLFGSEVFASSSSSSSSSTSASKSTKRQYLYQVEICLNKQFDPIDCPSESTCTHEMPIYYPPLSTSRRLSPLPSIFEYLKSPYLIL